MGKAELVIHKERGSVFADDVLATAILDWPLHHCRVIDMTRSALAQNRRATGEAVWESVKITGRGGAPATNRGSFQVPAMPTSSRGPR